MYDEGGWTIHEYALEQHYTCFHPASHLATTYLSVDEARFCAGEGLVNSRVPVRSSRYQMQTLLAPALG